MTLCDEHSFVLKVKHLAHDEKIHTKVWTQHGNNISLLRVYGISDKFGRERLLGYILLHAGVPTAVHAHTWYVSIAYSDEDDIRRKDPEPLKSDDHVRLYKGGIGKFDYLFCYKARTKEHDEAGYSDGATHLETADQWRDGL